MANKKVREILRLRRMEFDAEVEENRNRNTLDSMTRAQLIEYAEEKGIKVDKTAKKAEILETIKE